MRRRMRGKRETNVDLDITSFMNLMVILIPFLLLNAVFTQISVLKIDLPGSAPNSAEAPKPPPLILDINVYADRFEVNNAAVASGSSNLLGKFRLRRCCEPILFGQCRAPNIRQHFTNLTNRRVGQLFRRGMHLGFNAFLRQPAITK